MLVHEVFSDGLHSRHELDKTDHLPPNMIPSYKKLVLANPRVRLSVADFLQRGQRSSSFFDDDLIRFTRDIDQFGLKSEEEKSEFIRYVYTLTIRSIKLTHLITYYLAVWMI